MPYQWISEAPQKARLRLWPYRSLPLRGFAAVILGAFAMMLVPLLPFLGTALLWGLLPFVLAALALLWILLRRNYADARLTEELTLTPGQAHLVRTEPDGRQRVWDANPYWVQVKTHPEPVESYLTLTGGNREVEIGAFLSPGERAALAPQLEQAIARAAGYATPAEGPAPVAPPPDPAP